MSATTSGALKALIEGAGLGLAAYRDRAPADYALPIVVIQEGISRVPERDGDTGDPQAAHGVRELVQVTLFQAWRNADGTSAENYALPGALHRLLHGCRLPTSPTTVYGVLVVSSVRIPQVDGPGAATGGADGANVVQDTFTLEVRRNA